MFVKNRVFRAVCSSAWGLIVLACAAGTCPAHAQVTKSGAGYLIRMKFTKGTAASYTMNTTMAMPNGNNAKMNIPFKTQVLDVKGDMATVRYTVGPAMVNGRTQDAAKTIEVKMNNRGKVTGGPATQLQGMAMTLPEKPLKVGDTYSSSVKVGAGPQAMTVNATYTFLGIKTVGGMSAAQFSIKSSGKGAFSTTGTGVMALAVSDGSLVASGLSQSIVIKAGNKTQTINSQVSMTRN